MIDFIVSDSDGNILRQGSCPQSMMAIQAKSNECIIEGKVNDEEFYTVDMANGKPLKKNKAKIAAIKKHRADKRDAKDKERLIDQRCRELLRAQAIGELKNEGVI